MPESQMSNQDILQSQEYLSIRSTLESELRGILEAELTPENITVFYNDTIEKLVSFIDSVTEAYQNLNREHNAQNARELEDSALEFFGLTGLHEILEVASDKERSIKNLLLKAMNVTQTLELDNVILPTDKSRGGIKPGSGDYSKPLVIERSVMLFFMLLENFGNPEIAITTGNIDREMLRRVSYIAVDIPSLKRLVLVNDEMGNATYVFDTQVLESLGITRELVLGYTKKELSELIEKNPSVGKAVTYSSNWTQNIQKLLASNIKTQREQSNLPQVITSSINPMKGFLLNPEDNMYYGTIESIARRFGVEKWTADSVVTKLGTPHFMGRDLLGFDRELYCLNSAVEAELSRHLGLPRVESNGEWQGFYNQDGKYFGVPKAISDKLLLSTGLIQQIVRDNPAIGRITGLNSAGREGDLYSFDDVRERLSAHIDTPRVSSVDEGEQKRGFYLMNGNYYGSFSSLVSRINSMSPDNPITETKVKNIAKNAQVDSVKIRSLNGEIKDGYNLDQVYSVYLQLLKLPQIETIGEFAGCWLNPEEGTYYCTKAYFLQKFGRHQRDITKAVIGARHLQARDVLDRETTVYAMDDVTLKL